MTLTNGSQAYLANQEDWEIIAEQEEFLLEQARDITASELLLSTEILD
jgi:PHD/YefM family antitoxin component YafN of YafNO toxin-antitoxin module